MDILSTAVPETNAGEVDYTTGDVYGSGYGDNSTYYYYDYNYEDMAHANRARHVSHQVFLYVGGAIFLFGILGNVVSFAVLQTRAFRLTSSGFLLSALALTDNAVLCTGLLRHWILAVSGDTVDIRTLSLASCRTHTFFTYMTMQLSAWTLVLMTIERLLSVVLPMRAKDICTRGRIIFAWVMVLVVISAMNIHIFFTMDTQVVWYQDAERTICYHADHHSQFWLKVWPWIDSLISSVIPGAFLLIANVIIVKRLTTAKRQRRQSVRSISTEREVKAKTVTVMLIAISLLFLLTTTPTTIFTIGTRYWPMTTGMDIYNTTMGHIAVTIALYSNFALNFIMYCVSGAKFRKALVDMFCCRNTRSYRRRSSVTSSLNTASSSIRSAQYMRTFSTNSASKLM